MLNKKEILSKIFIMVIQVRPALHNQKRQNQQRKAIRIQGFQGCSQSCSSMLVSFYGQKLFISHLTRKFSAQIFEHIFIIINVGIPSVSTYIF